MRRFILFIFVFQTLALIAQNDSLEVVWRIPIPQNGGFAYPVLNPLCKDRVFLNEQEFDLSSGKFIQPDHKCKWANWTSDPDDPQYVWACEFGRQKIVLKRYNLKTNKLRTINFRKDQYFEISKAGIWHTDHKMLKLLDKQTFKVMISTPLPDLESANYRVWNNFFRPWGDNVLICEYWLYLKDKSRYERFLPLPEALQSCSPNFYVQFEGDVCVARLHADWPSIEYWSTPNSKAIEVPRYSQIVGHNYPYTWAKGTHDSIWQIDLSTGNKTKLNAKCENIIHGPHDGRYIGFYTAQYLAFYDKYNCQLRYINLDYGSKKPLHLSSDEKYIFLTYENRWDVLRFDLLDTLIKPSTKFVEYSDFQSDRDSLFKDLPGDFYPRYEAYIKLLNRYGKSQNLMIIESLERYKPDNLYHEIYSRKDSILEQIMLDYYAGNIHYSVMQNVGLSLIDYLGYKGDIDRALEIGKTIDTIDRRYKEEYYDQKIEILKITKNRLDSVVKVVQTSDNQRYATCRIYYELCKHKYNFYTPIDERTRIMDQANACYKDFLKEFPNSQWADNAQYDSLYFVDYEQGDSNDGTPEGDPVNAFEQFTKLLKDYPDSDIKPDILLRLAALILRGVYFGEESNIPLDTAFAYMQLIENQYKNKIQDKTLLQKMLNWSRAYDCAKKWKIEAKILGDRFSVNDLIYFVTKVKNISAETQIVDTAFAAKLRSNKGLKLEIHSAGCSPSLGFFGISLYSDSHHADTTSITLPPGGIWELKFLLDRETIYGYGDKKILTPGYTYTYNEYIYSFFPFSWPFAVKLSGQREGRFDME